jgi:hypothetical protein
MGARAAPPARRLCRTYNVDADAAWNSYATMDSFGVRGTVAHAA